MSDFGLYNKTKYFALMAAVTMVGATILALITKLTSINLFEEFLGMFGFFGIACTVVTAQHLERRFKTWLCK